MSNFSEVSKQVGWNPRVVEYPTMDQVEKALHDRDLKQVLTWQRFLPSPRSDEHRTIMQKIVHVFGILSRDR